MFVSFVCAKVASISKHYCFYCWPNPCRIQARELPSGMTAAITVTAPGTSGVNSLLDRAVIYFSVAEAQEGTCFTHAHSPCLTEAQKLMINYY